MKQQPIAFGVNEAAARAGVGRDAIYAAIRSGLLTARKLGKRTLILQRDLEAFIANLPELRLAQPPKTSQSGEQ